MSSRTHAPTTSVMALFEGSAIRLALGDCVDVMRRLPESSVHAVVTDPPYGLEFMGKEWDRPWAMGKVSAAGAADGTPFRRNAGTPSWAASGNPRCRNCGGTKYDRTRPNGCKCDAPDFPAEAVVQMRAFQAWCETWGREALRVLKPGGYLLAFSGTRTYHRMTTGLEEAGFEVRDMVDWLYGSGFPKHRAALKPGHEPVCLARKPLAGTLNANEAAHGTGALSIDACRIAGEPWQAHRAPGLAKTKFFTEGDTPEIDKVPHEGGRWPANVVLDAEAAAMLDEQTGISRSRKGEPRAGRNGNGWGMTATGAEYDDEGGASRFFYVAKPDAAERNGGLGQRVDLFTPDGAPDRNNHPTVKPIDLMRWLVRLVTPPGGVVLEPFLGSGTTAIACALEHRSVIGIEREPDYLRIARARIAHWAPGVPVFDLDNTATEAAA